MKSIYIKIKEELLEFNKANNIEFNIDSIRGNFNKTYKLNSLKKLGTWKKYNKNEQRIVNRLKLLKIKFTSVYGLVGTKIYYYNHLDYPKYSKATFVVFGLSQYEKGLRELKKIQQDEDLVSELLSIVKNIDSIDICFDTDKKPNIEKLSQHFHIKDFQDLGQTYYINNINTLYIDKITIYDKQLKNKLKTPLWRYEATIPIYNIKESTLTLALDDFMRDVVEVGSS